MIVVIQNTTKWRRRKKINANIIGWWEVESFEWGGTELAYFEWGGKELSSIWRRERVFLSAVTHPGSSTLYLRDFHTFRSMQRIPSHMLYIICYIQVVCLNITNTLFYWQSKYLPTLLLTRILFINNIMKKNSDYWHAFHAKDNKKH